MIRILTLLVLAFTLCACSTFQKKPDPDVHVVERTVPYECGEPAAADPYKARPVQWTVQTLATGAKVFALTAPMYENLMANMVNLLSTGQQVKGQRDFYAECIARSRLTPGTSATPPPGISDPGGIPAKP